MSRFSECISVTLLASCLAGGAGGGCATTVRPEARPADPVAVFLNNYGVHSSLMLPTPDGRFVEYSFGDYGYAALNRGGPHNALRALFASGQSGLGRRFLSVRPGDGAPRPVQTPMGVQKFFADRALVYVLVKELDERFRNGSDDPVRNPITKNVFVKDPDRYSIANNCNHMTGRLLRQLGCEVRGTTATPLYKVVGKQKLPPPLDTGYAVTPPQAPAPRPKPAQARRPLPSSSYTRVDVE